MGKVIEIKKEKRIYTTTIVVQTSYDPSDIGPTSLLMDVVQGGGEIIAKTTVCDTESENSESRSIYQSK